MLNTHLTENNLYLTTEQGFGVIFSEQIGTNLELTIDIDVVNELKSFCAKCEISTKECKNSIHKRY